MAQEQRFELVSTLGQGGMAEVFLGWMNSVGGLRRKVAIKRILPELIQKKSQLFQQMFVDEARLAFLLEHDNIVRVYDVGQTASTFFIVMEYVEGFDLKTVMEKLTERGIIFPLSIAIYITLQVCSGLGYAHTLADPDGKPLGLIHNDISPPNILIGRHGEVKVADFGLSDARSNNVATPEGMIKGKFAYISPECTHNPPQITSRSDIFSIGICLWEMLAGRKLFQRENDMNTFRAVRSCKIPDLKKIRPDVPDEILLIINKILAKDPANRYQTCEDVYLDLSSAATALEIPINRYDLSWLVNDLAGNRWKEFLGEKVSAAQQKILQDELSTMLPPGDAEMFAEIVTGMSEQAVADSEKAKEQNGNWVADVISDAGFDDGEIIFTEKRKSKPSNPAIQSDAANNLKLSSEENAKISLSLPSIPSTPSIMAPTKELSGSLPSAKSILTSNIWRRKKRRYMALAFVGVIGIVFGASIATILMVLIL